MKPGLIINILILIIAQASYASQADIDLQAGPLNDSTRVHIQNSRDEIKTPDEQGFRFRIDYREGGAGGTTVSFVTNKLHNYADFFLNSNDRRIDAVLNQIPTTRFAFNSAGALLLRKNGAGLKISLQDPEIYLTIREHGNTFFATNLNEARKVLMIDYKKFMAELNLESNVLTYHLERNLFHEFLRLVGINDNNYYYTNKLFPLYSEYVNGQFDGDRGSIK